MYADDSQPDTVHACMQMQDCQNANTMATNVQHTAAPTTCSTADCNDDATSIAVPMTCIKP